MAETRVPVYTENPAGPVGTDRKLNPIIARVRVNRDLDHWDGSNFASGVGSHRGLTRLRDGRYVIIVTSEWVGARPYGYVVEPEEALHAIQWTGNTHLLDRQKYRELKAMAADHHPPDPPHPLSYDYEDPSDYRPGPFLRL